MTAALIVIGIVLVLAAIPLAFSLGPLAFGIVLAWIGLRRVHCGLQA
jgi:hypothetical protein